jgi:hyperosmotically inducible periplasmic protein
MSKKIGFILLTCVLVLTAACAASPRRRSLGETLDDAVISNKLKAKYLSDKIINGFDINVDTWKGVVSIRGKADSQHQINRAIEVAELQQGVREVRSYLVLRQQEEEGLVKPKESFFHKKSPKKGEIEERTLGEKREPRPSPAKSKPVAKAKKEAKPLPVAKSAPKEKERNATKEEPKKPDIEERELIFRDSNKKDVTLGEPSPKDTPRKETSRRDTSHDSVLNEKPPRITDD